MLNELFGSTSNDVHHQMFLLFLVQAGSDSILVFKSKQSATDTGSDRSEHSNQAAKPHLPQCSAVCAFPTVSLPNNSSVLKSRQIVASRP
jgi:hypothetical protein